MFASLTKLLRPIAPLVAIGTLVLAMGGTWGTTTRALAAPVTSPTTPSSTAAGPPTAPTPHDEPPRPVRKEVTGKLNLNTATEEQLMLLPTVGPSKAERVVAWRKKNGGFKRTADLRRVKGFGYRTYKKLEPFLDIKGESTLSARRPST